MLAEECAIKYVAAAVQGVVSMTDRLWRNVLTQCSSALLHRS